MSHLREKDNLPKHYTENAEAYKFYVKRPGISGMHKAMIISTVQQANYKRAIQLEPNYALAYAGLADCYDVNYRGQSRLERVPIAKFYVK